jgi:exopolysaccharide biosynthesis protein
MLTAELVYYVELIDQVTSAQVLIVDPKEYEIRAARAKMHRGISREPVATMAIRYGAVAGINGGFWKADGSPAGILMIDNQWLGFSVKPRAAIGFNKDGSKFHIDQLLTVQNDGNITVLPQSDPPYTSSSDWNKLENITGGVPVLIRNGKVIRDFSSEKTINSFLLNRNRRTAIGILADGSLVFVVISSPYSKWRIKASTKSGLWSSAPGFTMSELAGYMKTLGCVDALNMDGGSSSAMYIDSNQIDLIDDATFAETNLVSDTILILKK